LPFLVVSVLQHLHGTTIDTAKSVELYGMVLDAIIQEYDIFLLFFNGFWILLEIIKLTFGGGGGN